MTILVHSVPGSYYTILATRNDVENSPKRKVVQSTERQKDQFILLQACMQKAIHQLFVLGVCFVPLHSTPLLPIYLGLVVLVDFRSSFSWAWRQS